MISVFPDPRPDEPISSIGGRFQDSFQLRPKHLPIRYFFGTDNLKVVVDLPSHLGVLVSRLPDGNRYTVDYFLDNNTLLPLYAFFLPQDRISAIRQEMTGTGQQNIHLMAGILSCRVQTPDYFMLCQACIEDDRQEFGTCYFHRSHHAPGVKLCNKHDLPLLQTSFETKANHEFISAETVATESTMKPLEINEEDHSDLLEIAQDVHWLLNTRFDALGLESIRQRYLTILIEQGFASPTGHVKTTKLIKAFQSRFSNSFLQEFNCEIDGHQKRNWIARIVQADQPQHPIRHLLFLRFLGISIKEFYNPSNDNLPFGNGPWPCLNAACDKYLEPVILNVYSGFTRSVSRRPLGTFSCPHCEFAYSRTGPDKSVEDKYKRTKIVLYGYLWNARLRQLWSDSSVYFKDIAKELGVNQSTVYEQVKRLNLGARGTVSSIYEPETDSKDLGTNLLTVINSYREQWLSALDEFHEAGVAQLLQLIPHIYSTLDRLDYDWLNNHKPDRPEGNKVPLIDWPDRDELLVKQAPIIARRLKDSKVSLQRVTLNAIAIELGWGQGSIQRDIDHLPMSAKILPSLLETHEDFAFRRIQCLIDTIVEESNLPSRAEFIKRAGLNAPVKTQRILEAVDKALVAIEKRISQKNK